MIPRTFRIALQLLILIALSQVGYLLAAWAGLPLPGNVLGMVLLLGLLWSGAVPLRFVEDAALLLLRHLAFFFVPIAVGLMSYGHLLREQGMVLLLILFASATLGIFAGGFVTDRLFSSRERMTTWQTH